MVSKRQFELGPESKFLRPIPQFYLCFTLNLTSCFFTVPSDTKLLLTKNYFEIIIFEKLRVSRVISGKSLSFSEILRGQIPSKITKNNSQGIICVIISCQRVSQLKLCSAGILEPRFEPRFTDPWTKQS